MTKKSVTDGRTDGQTDDSTKSIEHIFQKCALKMPSDVLKGGIYLTKLKDFTFLRLNLYGTLRKSNFKILSIFSGPWTPKYIPKVSSDLFYGEIYLTKLKVFIFLRWNLYERYP
jgi:hypothetical protein